MKKYIRSSINSDTQWKQVPYSDFMSDSGYAMKKECHDVLDVVAYVFELTTTGRTGVEIEEVNGAFREERGFASEEEAFAWADKTLPALAALDLSSLGSSTCYQLARVTTDLDILSELAHHESKLVRACVADNPATTVDILMRLVRDRSSDVRANVAARIDDPELLRMLSSDRHQWVRRAVASNRNTPQDVLYELADDPEPWVRYNVAENPSSGPELTRDAKGRALDVLLDYADRSAVRNGKQRNRKKTKR